MTDDRERPDDHPQDGPDVETTGAVETNGAMDGAELARDGRLVALLRGARDHYHVPAAPPPADALWAAIEARHFGPAAPVAAPPTVRRVAAGRWPIAVRWRGPAVGLAAGLLFGVGIGAALWRGADAARAGAGVGVGVAGGAPSAGAEGGGPGTVVLAAADDPAYDAVAIEYFDQAVALLATLPTRLDDHRPDARLAAQARDLLSTTRLLLDSPAAGHDAELQALLDDLELVLAQMVRLPAVRDSSQAALIHEALQARDVLPRLRTAAAQASAPIQSFGADD